FVDAATALLNAMFFFLFGGHPFGWDPIWCTMADSGVELKIVEHKFFDIILYFEYEYRIGKRRYCAFKHIPLILL
ncbi:hypothetical protein ACJX0J_039814, partial [Zea mays]